LATLLGAALLRGEQRLEAEVHFLPAAALTVLLAVEAVRNVLARAHGDAPARIRPWVRRGAIIPAVVAVVVALVLVPRMSRRGNHIAEDYGRHLLEPLPPDAVLFMNADTEAFAAFYLQGVLGIRPDVTLRFVGGPPHRDARGHPATHRRDLVAGAEAGASPAPVHVTLPKPPFDPGLAMVDGLAYRYGDPEAVPRWREVTLRHRPGARLTRFEEVALARVAFQEAAYHFAVGDRAAAMEATARARRHGLRSPRFLVDLGTLLVHANQPGAAETMWRRAISDDPGQILGWLHLVRLALMNGDREGALALYREARAHHPRAGELDEIGHALGMEPRSR
jgi:hypothetical protein